MTQSSARNPKTTVSVVSLLSIALVVLGASFSARLSGDEALEVPDHGARGVDDLDLDLRAGYRADPVVQDDAVRRALGRAITA